jgi:hypothetical protein
LFFVPPQSQVCDILSGPIKYHPSTSSDLSKGIRKSAREKEKREEGEGEEPKATKGRKRRTPENFVNSAITQPFEGGELVCPCVSPVFTLLRGWGCLFAVNVRQAGDLRLDFLACQKFFIFSLP